MQVKDSLKNIWKIIQEHFAIPFCASVFFVALGIYIFKLQFYLFSLETILYTGLTSGFVAFFLWFKKLDEKSKLRNIVIEFCKKLLLITILIISLFNFQILKNIGQIEYILTIFSIFSGSIIFYANRKHIEEGIKSEKLEEIETEKKRNIYRDKTFRYLQKFPILENVIKKIYNEGFVYIGGIIFIIILSIMIKAPYLNLSFTGEHSQKYNGYVEPALVMIRDKTFLPNTKLFESNPLTKFYGDYNSIGGGLPITEWLIFFSNQILPTNLSLEFKTRIIMNLIGIGILILSYILYKNIFTKKSALLFITLITILPTFEVISYLTIADSIMFVFFILSLIQFFTYLETNNSKNLFFSALSGGVSIMCKDTSAILLAPLFFFVILKQGNYKKIFLSGIYYFTLLVSPKILYFLTLYNLPKNTLFYLNLSLLPIIFYYCLYRLDSNILKYDFKIKKQNFILIAIPIIIVLTLLIILTFKRVTTFSNGFLIDKELLNLKFFFYLIKNKISQVNGPEIFLIGIVSYILGSTITYTKKIFTLIISSGILYIFLASKVIYFHSYYVFYLGFILCFFTSIILLNILKIVFPKYYGLLIILVIINLIVTLNPLTSEFLLKQKKGVDLASNYIKNNMKNDEFFMFNREAHILTIYSLKNSFDFRILNRPSFKDEIEQNGIQDTFNKYKIKYYITTNSEPKYEELISIFSKKIQPETEESLRSQIILSEINNTKSIFSNLNERKEEIQRFELPKHFQLEQQFGDYYIYSIN